MNEHEDAVVVFTARSPERIVREGGSQAWLLNPTRAKQCTWLVCTQNRHNQNHEFSDATEPHGCGFLLGRISGVHRSREEGGENRWLIRISEYAPINFANLWDHGRNPVRYTSLEELGIGLDGVEFQTMPNSSELPPRSDLRSVFSARKVVPQGGGVPLFSYAREKFWQAVDALATSDRNIQERLAGAAQYLRRLNASDLPEEYRGEFNAVLSELTKEKPIGDEGTIVATTRQLSSEEAKRTASKILSVYTGLHGGI